MERSGGGEGGEVESVVAEAAWARGGAWSARRHGRAAALREMSFFLSVGGECKWMSR